MSKEKFNFNQLCQFYSDWELERWRIMLYANIDVFLCHSWFQIQFDYDDIVQDIVMEIDKWIQESLSKWFKPPQVYKFIKLRVRWWLVNRSNRQDQMMYFKSFWDDYIDWIYWEWIGDVDASMIKNLIYEMDDPIRKILLLKHYSDFTLDKIAKYLEISISKTTKLYKEWIYYLQHKLNNELSSTSESETHWEEG